MANIDLTQWTGKPLAPPPIPNRATSTSPSAATTYSSTSNRHTPYTPRLAKRLPNMRRGTMTALTLYRCAADVQAALDYYFDSETEREDTLEAVIGQFEVKAQSVIAYIKTKKSRKNA
ncbi:phage associated protein [Neisseria gonorrhoeae]|uniref:Phage associated protein n=1 Tax=Neisseria gonorrhoeae TaxID=485 RepID=A0A378VT24_NEIGO|nr:phage associated protein [Neisseria gonorrhoeae]